MENIQIRENYKEYSPSINVVAIIERLLSGVSSQQVVGLDSILLRNVNASHPKKRHIRHRGKKLHLNHCSGLYHPSTKDACAWIELFPDNIFPASMPKWLQKLSVIQDLFFADALFHEIGHHIDSGVGRQQDSEGAAEKWRKTLLRQYLRKHYSYLRPFKKVIRPMLKFVIFLIRLKK